MGFKATDYVEPLEFDFRPMHDYHGTIREPSDQDISRFLRRWYHLIAELRKATVLALAEATQAGAATVEELATAAEDKAVPPGSADEAAAAMAEIDWVAVDDETDQSPQTKAARATLTQMCKLVEDLSHGTCRSDQLRQVPMRVRGVFFGWLVGQLTDQGKGLAGLSTS